MSDQEIKNATIVLQETLGPIEIREVVKRSTGTNKSDAKIDKIIKNVIQSSKQARLSTMENEAIISSLSASFSQFDEAEWATEKELGKGAYGVVSSMSSKLTPGKKVARKEFRDIEIRGIPPDVIRETGCYALLGSSRPTYYDDIVNGIKITQDSISIALKLASGTLYDYALLLNQKQRINKFGDVYKRCIDVLEQVHACNIVHADIKARNILVWWNDDKDIEKLIIADFGLASSRPDYCDVVYTPGFRPPELCDIEEEDKENHRAGKASDVWAMGMTLVEFLTRSTWKYTYDVDELPHAILISTGYQEQILKMLDPFVEERMVIEEPILVFPKRDWTLKSLDKTTNITLRHLQLTFSWLWEISKRFKLLPATILQAIDITCRLLHVKNVYRDDLQGYTITALLIACKWGELRELEYSDAKYITASTYTIDQIKQFEIIILEKLNCLVYIPGLEKLASELSKIKFPILVSRFLDKNFVTDPNKLLDYTREFIQYLKISDPAQLVS